MSFRLQTPANTHCRIPDLATTHSTNPRIKTCCPLSGALSRGANFGHRLSWFALKMHIADLGIVRKLEKGHPKFFRDFLSFHIDKHSLAAPTFLLPLGIVAASREDSDLLVRLSRFVENNGYKDGPC